MRRGNGHIQKKKTTSATTLISNPSFPIYNAMFGCHLKQQSVPKRFTQNELLLVPVSFLLCSCVHRVFASLVAGLDRRGGPLNAEALLVVSNADYLYQVVVVFSFSFFPKRALTTSTNMMNSNE